MRIEIIKDQLSESQVKEWAAEIHGDFLKGVVDLQTGTIALGGEMHADAETFMLNEGYLQDGLWGFNLVPDQDEDTRIEYNSFINIRPREGNPSIEIKDKKLRDQIKKIIDQWIIWNG